MTTDTQDHCSEEQPTPTDSFGMFGFWGFIDEFWVPDPPAITCKWQAGQAMACQGAWKTIRSATPVGPYGWQCDGLEYLCISSLMHMQPHNQPPVDPYYGGSSG